MKLKLPLDREVQRAQIYLTLSFTWDKRTFLLLSEMHLLVLPYKQGSQQGTVFVHIFFTTVFSIFLCQNLAQDERLNTQTEPISAGSAKGDKTRSFKPNKASLHGLHMPAIAGLTRIATYSPKDTTTI